MNFEEIFETTYKHVIIHMILHRKFLLHCFKLFKHLVHFLPQNSQLKSLTHLVEFSGTFLKLIVQLFTTRNLLVLGKNIPISSVTYTIYLQRLKGVRHTNSHIMCSLVVWNPRNCGSCWWINCKPMLVAIRLEQFTIEIGRINRTRKIIVSSNFIFEN